MTAKTLTFYQPDFLAALAAYQLQKAGYSIKIILSGQLKEHLHSEYTSYYPEKLTDLVSSKLNYRFLNSLGNLFPHLITRKRVYTFHTQNEWNAKSLAAIDKLMVYDREMASFPIQPNTIFAKECQLLKKGAQVIEYRFDRYQACYELLKNCKKEGALLLFDDQPELNDRTIYSKAITAYTSTTKGKQLPVENAVILKSEGFEIELFNIKNAIQINVHSSSEELELTNVIEVLNDLDIQLEEKAFISTAKNTFENDGLLLADASLNNIKAGWNHVVSQLRNSFNVNKTAFKLENSKEKLSANYTNLQLACEQQYDLAKQTGIQFRAFEKLYYRYIDSIEEMIESAYEKMSFERDPVKIWVTVLEEHLEEQWNSLKR